MAPNNELPPEYLPDPFQQIITLKDNTVLNGRGALNEITDELFLWPKDLTSFVDATAIFTDPNKTDHIRVDYSRVEYNEYDGYTRLYGVMSDPQGKLTIRLRKGVS